MIIMIIMISIIMKMSNNVKEEEMTNEENGVMKENEE